MIVVRPGMRLDIGEMTDLLNEIIAIGGTTALTNRITRDELWDWIGTKPERSAWHVAEDGGRVIGFQWIGPFGDLPDDTCEITTFVKVGRTGLGVGSRLFDATRAAAKALGYRFIQAEIRADNEGGLIFYQSRGFQVTGRKEGARLADGTSVDKILKRFDLQ